MIKEVGIFFPQGFCFYAILKWDHIVPAILESDSCNLL